MTRNSDSLQQEVLQIFKDSGALLDGHFLLRSGLHSRHFFQCAQVCQYMDKVTRLAELLIEKLPSKDFETVVAPAMGGLVIGQEIARQMGKRFIFVEKIDDKLALRRNFKIGEGEKVLITEDVVTRGGRVREALDIVTACGGKTVATAVLVDRSQGETTFPEAPLISLVELSFPTYDPSDLPEDLQKTEAIKPGS